MQRFFAHPFLQFILLSLFFPCSFLFGQSPLPNVFSHTFEEMRDAFDAWQVPAGDHAEEVLVEEISYRYDARGTMTSTHRRVWKLKSRQVSEYGIVSREYAPWYQNPPEIRARVFAPNGREFTLSKEDITTSPAGSREQGILSDRLIVNAALPGVKVGAIIEEVVEITERDPFFERGSATRLLFDTLVPAKYLRLEIDAPEDLAIQILFRPKRPADLVESSRIQDGRRWIQMELPSRKQIAIQSFESEIPRDVYPQQSITINTGDSWQRIARSYSEIVDGRLNNDTIDEIATEILSAPEAAGWNTVEQKIHGCAEWVRQNIRYTGVQLGNAAIVPARPSTVVGRRFGDCKDQSTLLVGLLRAYGVRADVALVNATTPRSPSPDAPCLNGFNHAIVVVRHDGKTMWIDPTYPGSTPQCIPSYLQAHLALIAHPDEQSLTMIPTQGVEGNQEREVRKVTITPAGNATVHSESFQSGYFAADARTAAFSQSFEEDERNLVQYYVESGLPVKARLIRRSDPALDEPTFVRETELKDLPLESHQLGRYRIDLTFRNVVSQSPLFHALNRNERGVEIPRQDPAESFVPYRWSRTSTLIAPAEYRIVAPAHEQRMKIGTVELALVSKHLEDGSMQVEQSMTVDVGILTPDELQQLSALEKQLESIDHPLNFASVIEPSSQGAGPDSPALTELRRTRQAWQSEPSGDTGYEYVTALVGIGQVEEATSKAHELIARMPEEGMGYTALAYASLHDVAGREMGYGADIETAKTATRKAIELSPHRWQPYYLLTLLLNVDEQGVHHNRPEGYEQAVQWIEAAEAKGVHDERLLQRKIANLILLHRYDDAIKLASEYGLEQLLNCAKAVKAGKASRWNDIVALREKIPSPNEREVIASISEQFLLTDRDYEIPSRLVFTMRGLTENEIADRRRGMPKIEKVDRPIDPTLSPEILVREYLFRVVSQGKHPEGWSDLLVSTESNSAMPPGWNPNECTNTEILAFATSVFRRQFEKVKACSDRIYDTMNLYPFKIEGDDTLGHFVQIKISPDVYLAIVKEGDRYRVLPTGPFDRNYALQAQRFLDAGKPESASRWIEWALKSKASGAMLAPDTGHPVKRYWTTVRKKTPEVIQTAIHMLLFPSDPTEARKQYLMEAFEHEKSAIKRQWLLMSMMMTDDAPATELLQTVQRYMEEFPNSPLGKIRLVSLEATHGNFQPMRDYVSDPENANDPMIERFEGVIQFHEERYSELLTKRIANASEKKTIDAWNEAVWAGLFADEVKPEWTEELRNVLGQEENTAALHTLACAEAHLGNVEIALDDLVRLISMQSECIHDVDYWVLGRIAEHADLPDRARHYYAKVKPTTRPGSAYKLAQRRLAVLNAAEPSP